ncbi:MAG: hypothetical protein LBC88_07485 [Spirochaetaceae bacterium]|jgi:hypothetical protein|nr:hypothetical protein [Spirochaetaceae bacterium]
MRNRPFYAALAGVLAAVFAACPMDAPVERPVTITLATAEERAVIAFLEGAWFSGAGGQTLVGYRIGKIENIARDLAEYPDLAYWTDKGFDPAAPRVLCGASGSGGATGSGGAGNGVVKPGAYYIYYYDNFEDDYFGYLAVVHVVNIFQAAEGEPPQGALIIEYLEHCFPEWADFTAPLRPFCAVYYRILSRAADGAGHDTVQMANPVNLAKLDEWSRSQIPGNGPPLPAIHYAVETAALDEARAAFRAGTDAACINWGVVMPQNREHSPVG